MHARGQFPRSKMRLQRHCPRPSCRNYSTGPAGTPSHATSPLRAFSVSPGRKISKKICIEVLESVFERGHHVRSALTYLQTTGSKKAPESTFQLRFPSVEFRSLCLNPLAKSGLMHPFPDRAIWNKHKVMLAEMVLQLDKGDGDYGESLGKLVDMTIARDCFSFQRALQDDQVDPDEKERLRKRLEQRRAKVTNEFHAWCKSTVDNPHFQSLKPVLEQVLEVEPAPPVDRKCDGLRTEQCISSLLERELPPGWTMHTQCRLVSVNGEPFKNERNLKGEADVVLVDPSGIVQAILEVKTARGNPYLALYEDLQRLRNMTQRVKGKMVTFVPATTCPPPQSAQQAGKRGSDANNTSAAGPAAANSKEQRDGSITGTTLTTASSLDESDVSPAGYQGTTSHGGTATSAGGGDDMMDAPPSMEPRFSLGENIRRQLQQLFSSTSSTLASGSDEGSCSDTGSGSDTGNGNAPSSSSSIPKTVSQGSLTDDVDASEAVMKKQPQARQTNQRGNSMMHKPEGVFLNSQARGSINPGTIGTAAAAASAKPGAGGAAGVAGRKGKKEQQAAQQQSQTYIHRHRGATGDEGVSSTVTLRFSKAVKPIYVLGSHVSPDDMDAVVRSAQSKLLTMEFGRVLSSQIEAWKEVSLLEVNRESTILQVRESSFPECASNVREYFQNLQAYDIFMVDTHS